MLGLLCKVSSPFPINYVFVGINQSGSWSKLPVSIRSKTESNGFQLFGVAMQLPNQFCIHMKLIWTIFLGYSSSHSFGRGLLLADPSTTPRVAKQQCPASQFMILVTNQPDDDSWLCWETRPGEPGQPKPAPDDLIEAWSYRKRHCRAMAGVEHIWICHWYYISIHSTQQSCGKVPTPWPLPTERLTNEYAGCESSRREAIFFFFMAFFQNVLGLPHPVQVSFKS